MRTTIWSQSVRAAIIKNITEKREDSRMKKGGRTPPRVKKMKKLRGVSDREGDTPSEKFEKIPKI